MYNTKTSYDIQFTGSFTDFEWNKVWEARVEPKCKFFTWLLIQNWLWSAGRVIKHGGQANPIYQLCRAQPESIMHMIAQCAYSKSVWAALSTGSVSLFRHHLQTTSSG
jgi:hypothetical protein